MNNNCTNKSVTECKPYANCNFSDFKIVSPKKTLVIRKTNSCMFTIDVNTAILNSFNTQNTDAITLTGNGLIGSPLTATLVLDPSPNNLAQVTPDGLLVNVLGFGYTDEQAQDAVGGILNPSEFTYNDATPLISINQINWSKIVGAPSFSTRFGFSGEDVLATGNRSFSLAGNKLDISNGNLTITNGNIGIDSVTPAQQLTIQDRLFLYTDYISNTQARIETANAFGLHLAGGNVSGGVVINPNSFNVSGGNVRFSHTDANYVDINLFSGGASEQARIGLQVGKFYLASVLSVANVQLVLGDYYSNGNDTTLTIDDTNSRSVLTNELRLSAFTNARNDGVTATVLFTDASGNLRHGTIAGSGGTALSQTLFSGDGLATTFNIAHGLVGTPKAVVTAASVDAKNITHITVDATNIVVNYAVAPPVGVNNITINWTANL